jgi:type IV pilus assembly protein PilV
MKRRQHQAQSGASLIEVLVAILLLSFGMLALGAMMSFAVQAPKMSAFRAAAANLASSHVERIRANPDGFTANSYTMAMSYDGSTNIPALNECAYPSCDKSTLATMDIAATNRAARIELPAGGMLMNCDTSPCTKASYGNLWILWLEPSTVAGLGASSDNCPAAASALDPKPRCLYVRFKVE